MQKTPVQQFIEKADIKHCLITEEQIEEIDQEWNNSPSTVMRKFSIFLMASGMLLTLAIIGVMFLGDMKSLSFEKTMQSAAMPMPLLLLGMFLQIKSKEKYSQLCNEYGGWGTDKYSREEIERIIKKADSKNSAENQMVLANLYKQGCWVKEDAKRSIAYYALAADNGKHEAALRVADMYKYGNGVKQSDQNEYEWLLKAKELGNLEAIKRLNEITSSENGGSGVGAGLVIGAVFGIAIF